MLLVYWCHIIIIIPTIWSIIIDYVNVVWVHLLNEFNIFEFVYVLMYLFFKFAFSLNGVEPALFWIIIKNKSKAFVSDLKKNNSGCLTRQEFHLHVFTRKVATIFCPFLSCKIFIESLVTLLGFLLFIKINLLFGILMEFKKFLNFYPIKFCLIFLVGKI